MKNLLLRSVLSFFLVSAFTLVLKAQPKRVCFFDDFGLKYQFTNIHAVGKDIYYGEGTTDAYPKGKARIWLDLSRGIHFGVVEVHAINGEPDGCNFYSDSFILKGVSYVLRSNGETVEYFASGFWESYCFGSLLNLGTSWTGFGPCNKFSDADVRKNATNTSKKKPFEGSGTVNSKKDDFSIKIIPNPIKDKGQLEYKLTSPGKINITIYDFMHRQVKVLVNEYKTPGNYVVQWNAVNANGSRVSQGLYEAIATVGGKTYSNAIQVLP